MKNDVRFEHVLWKISDFVSFPMYRFTLVIKLSNFDFGSHWHILMFFHKKISDLIMSCELVPDLNFVIKLGNTNFRFYRNSLLFFNERTFCEFKICPGVSFLFWHYYRTSFELEKFLMILGYTEILKWKLCIWTATNGCCPRPNKQEMILLSIDGNMH